ncbi:PAS domain S-box-containing protein/diguanylate cyclase (GGDEF) domain-containing protein [Abditibacterium utsteinense]|uniref:PAS domain S-box-containing protein/diguanylate cyclase (GGDEF) domain-containing protein n=1 Tax=Abditibacterium utsteinense TaxID=1960156 RepID=A0A2S8SVU2_9BACT|nr:EAL domain-containing protein [Abditibacterium utsteinense]PQV64911.1 PAS domain S-box-containing protein/diguanylate cyclase (GGDEF) domain-containing protein [Abditibacterium utsteinense]
MIAASANPFSAFLPLADDETAQTTRGQFLSRYTNDLIFEVDNNFKYRFVSPNHQALLGFAPLELLGRNLRDGMREADGDFLSGEQLADLSFQGEQATACRLLLRQRDGNFVGCEGTMQRLSDGFLFACHDVSQRERLSAELEVLGAVAREISVQRNLSELLPKISQLLQPLISFDRLFLTLLQGDTLIQVATDSPLAPGFPDLSRALWPNQPIWHMLETGWMWSQENFQEATHRGPWVPPDYRTRSFINVPLLVEGKPIGVLHFDAHQPQTWPEDQLRLARLIGAQLASVVQGFYLLRGHEEQETALAQSNALLRATQEAAAEGICLVNSAGELVSYNRRFAALWPLESEAESLKSGQVMAQVLAKMADPDEFIAKISEFFDAQDASSRDEILLGDGRTFERYSAPAFSDDNRSFGRIWTFSDITERKDYEKKLAHQAFHDAVTGLPNRVLFVNHLERALTKTERTGHIVAVLFLDLDRFKVVNDSLGHEKGDQLLVEVARRVRQSLRPGDVAARFGGDEFVVLLEEVTSEDDATRIADRIALNLRTPFLLGSHEVNVTASVGIVLSGAPGAIQSDADDLLRKADVAMYRAKSKGKAQYEVFSEQLSGEALERLQLEIDLASALKRGELDVFYQPLVDLKGGKIRAFEALVRWNHPTRGMVSPAQFIPIAEETGQIIVIGALVLRVACAQAKAWSDLLGEPVLMHVNLSARQFEQASLPLEIARVLRESDLPAQQLMVEITESAVMTDAKAAISQLSELKKLGVHISIDDFGTGYSSLAYLEFFPIDLLKIDRAFVSRLAEGTVLVRAIASLGHAMKMEIAAEGIENKEQLAQLREMGVEWGQGFLISKPVPAPDAEKLLGLMF